MEASVFVRRPNATEYSKLGSKKFAALPRVDEFISDEWEGGKKYFQVVAIHHTEGAIEVYAVEAAPPWQIKQSRSIGFGR